jgi:hypothetical protein
MGRACSMNGEKRTAYRVLAEKPERKRPLGRPKRRWVDNIIMDLRGIKWNGLIWLRQQSKDFHVAGFDALVKL